MGSKKHLVHLKVPSAFLATLPAIPQPQSKQKAKKTAADASTTAATTASAVDGARLATVSLRSSPVPKEEPRSNGLPVKQSSTAAITNKPSLEFQTSRNGNQAKKWGRSTRQFKTFTGFKVSVKNWVHKDSPEVKMEADTLLAGT